MKRGELIQVAGSAASVRLQAAKKLAAERDAQLAIERAEDARLTQTEAAE